jgi:multidrug efflux pump subunit AcrA (membrane-fusion protein)
MRSSSALLGRASLLLVLAACTKEEGKAAGAKAPVSNRPAVTDQGTTITFIANSPGLQQLASAKASRGAAVVSVRAPAHVVATVSSSGDHIVLFESADVTTIWSQYRQGKAAVDRTTKALARVKQMYDNQGATGRDVTEAETDAATTRANLAEFEGRLRNLGFNTTELEHTGAGMAWLIADVPEVELQEVQRGSPATIAFNSFPDAPVKGKVGAIGDVVDPVTRTVKIRIEVPNGAGRYLPGMYARVAFDDARRSVVLLPSTAIITVEEHDYAFVRTAPNEFVRRQVTLERASADSVIVVAGLHEGDDVVTTGTMLLKGLSFGY